MTKEQLNKKITEANDAYYNSSSIMSDEEYDALVLQLQQIDPENEVLKKVGAEPTSKEWKKEKHLFPLGSLSKFNNPEEMQEWIIATLQSKPTLVAEKLDGLSIGLQYEDGKLIKALLRGGGSDGENIMSNAVKMKGIVKQLSENFNGVLRGEVMMKTSDYQEHFKDFSNPRNAASGISRRSSGEGSEHLSLIMYDVLSNEREFEKEENKFSFLKDNKFLTPNYKVCQTYKEVNDCWKEYQETIRASLDYEIDGLVVSCNDVEFQQSLGESNLRPKGKKAFKFSNQYVEGIVSDIFITVGNSGRIVPMAKFSPEIYLMGAMVAKATLHNFANVKNLGIDIGAKVQVCRAGEIIPFIKEVSVSTGTTYATPTNCPKCDAALITKGEYLQCPNTANCPAQVQGRVVNWVSELNLLEWGEALIERLTEAKKVISIADLYKLKLDDLANLERMGEKSAKKALDILWANPIIPLEVFIGGLSIPLIGQSSIKLLTEAGFDTMDKICSLSIPDMEKIKGLGPERAKSLYDGLKKNKSMIDEMLSLGLSIKEKMVGKLTGKSFAITGTLTNKRAVLENMITEAGGIVKSSVGKGLTYLIINDLESTSSKAVSARKFNTTLASEDDLLKMLNG